LSYGRTRQRNAYETIGAPPTLGNEKAELLVGLPERTVAACCCSRQRRLGLARATFVHPVHFHAGRAACDTGNRAGT